MKNVNQLAKSAGCTLVLLLCLSFHAFAVNYYWVNGSGNWSQFATHWAKIPNPTLPAHYHANIPTADDDVFFGDTNGGAPYTVTVDAGSTVPKCHHMDWTGVPAGTVWGGGGGRMDIYGSLMMDADMTMTFNNEVHFISNDAATKQIWSKTVHFSNTVFFEGTTGGWQLMDDTFFENEVIQTGGLLETLGNALSIASSFYGNVSSGSTGQLHLGSSEMNLFGVALFRYTAFQFDAGTSHIKMHTSSYLEGPQYFTSPIRFYNITYFGNISNGQGGFAWGHVDGTLKFMQGGAIHAYGNIVPELNNVIFMGDGYIYNAVNYHNLTLTAGKTYTVSGYYPTWGTDQTILPGGSLTALGAGTCSEFITIKSWQYGTHFNLINNSGTTQTVHCAILEDCHATGTNPLVCEDGVDLGNNTGWTFNNPHGSMDLYWVGGAGNWNDPAHWSDTDGGAPGTCIPNGATNVHFTALSGFSMGNKIQVPVDAYCADMDWTGVTGLPEIYHLFGGSSNLHIYGSVTLAADMNFNFGGTVRFRTSNIATITSVSQGFDGFVVFEGSGVWELQDTFKAVNHYLFHKRGTFKSLGQPMLINYWWGNAKEDGSLNNMDAELFLDGPSGSSNVFLVKSAYSGNKGHFRCFYQTGKFHAAQSHFIGLNGGYIDCNPPVYHNFWNVTFNPIDHAGDFLYGNVLNKITFLGGANLASSSVYNLLTPSYFHEAEFHQGAYIYGNNTYDHLTMSGGYSYKLEYDNSVQTITSGGSFNLLNGSCTAPIYLYNPIPGHKTTIRKEGASTNFNIHDAIFDQVYADQTTGATYTATNSFAVQPDVEASWNISNPSSRDLYWVGGDGTWNDPAHWSLASGGAGGECPPTAQDNVFFNGGSGLGGGQAVTLSARFSFCKNMDWTGVASSTLFNSAVAPSDPYSGNNLMIFGSLAFSPSMTNEVTGICRLRAKGPATIKSAGQTFKNDLLFWEDTGSWTLLDDLSTVPNSNVVIDHWYGELTTNNHNITCGGWNFTYNYAWYNPFIQPSAKLNLGSSRLKVWAAPAYNSQAHFNGYVAGNFNAGTSEIILEATGPGDNIYAASSLPQIFNDITIKGTGGLYGGQVNGSLVIHKTGFVSDGGLINNLEFKDDGGFYRCCYAGERDVHIIKFAPGKRYTFEANFKVTIVPYLGNEGQFIAQGLPGQYIEMKSNTPGVQANIVMDDYNGTSTCTKYLFLTDMHHSGTGAPGTVQEDIYVPTPGGNVSNSTGWLFFPCNPCPASIPVLDASSITVGCPPAKARLVLANLKPDEWAIWYTDPAAMTTIVYNGGTPGPAGNLFEPNITGPTTYYARVYSDGGLCESTVILTVNIGVNTPPMAVFSVTGGGPVCSGGSGVSVGLDDSDTGVSYQLQRDGLNVGALVAGTGNALSFGLQTVAGTYTVVATPTGTACTATMNGNAVVVSSQGAPAVAVAAYNAPLCLGNSDLMLSESGGNGVSWLWAGPGGYNSSQQNPVIGNTSLSTNGTYTVTVTATSGCTATATVVVAGAASPTAAVLSGSVPFCFESNLGNGSTPGRVNISGGTGPFTVVLNDGVSNITRSNYTNNAALSVAVYNTTTFTLVSVTDANGCTVLAGGLSGSATAIQSPGVDASDNLTQPTCAAPSSGAINITVQSGLPPYTFQWDDGPTTEDRSGLAFGVYYLTITDAGGCEYFGEYAIEEPQNCCSVLTNAPAEVTVANSTCSSCALSGGSIAAPGGAPCPNGFTLQYQVNGDSWSSVLPVYAQSGPAQTIQTRCSCDNDPNNNSPASVGVTTVPGVCTPPVATITAPAATCQLQQINLSVANAGPMSAYNWSGEGVVNTSTFSTTATPTTSGPHTYAVTVTSANGCSALGSVSVNVNARPAATLMATPNPVCQGATLNLSAPAGASTYQWTGSGVNNQNSATTTAVPSATGAQVYAVTVTSSANCTNTGTATVQVNALPAATLTATPNPVCQNTSLNLQAPAGGSTYNWSGNGVSNTTNNTTSATPSATGAQTYAVTVTNANGCSATGSATVQVNRTPNAVATPSAQTVCSGVAITPIVLSGAVPNTTFNWTRDNTAAVTGPAASGSGNVSGAFTNTTNAPVTVTFTITPTANNCAGAPITATVLVNPTPNAVATPSAQTVCSGAAITPMVLSGAVANTTFNWTRDNTIAVTGPAASGSGNVSGAFTNTTNAPVTVTFTITPTANNCAGAPITATVLVNPTPNAVATLSAQTVCSGTAITPIVLSGAVPNTTFNWTRDHTATVTGPAASGSGDISGAFTNTTNAPVTVTFTITPAANGCAGAPVTATVLVNPTPDATAMVFAQTICSGTFITPIVPSGSVPNTTFNWTRDNTATVTGIPASGNGSISGILVNNAGTPVTVTFTVTPTTNNCQGAPFTATVLVTAQATQFVVSGSGTRCATDAGIPVTLSGSQVGFFYTLLRDGVVVSAQVPGTGGPLNFGPQTEAGFYTVSTFSETVCITPMTGLGIINVFDCTIELADPCQCLNNATTLTNGQFGETVRVRAPSGQTWTVTEISGLYTNASPAPPAAPLPVTVGTVLQNPFAQIYTLDGRHVDAVGYTLAVSNGRGTTLYIGNTCEYPNPVITSDLNGPFCLYSDPVPLTGNPGDFEIDPTNSGFTVNGVPATSFDPGAGLGTYVIEYTVDGRTPKIVNDDDPGCVQRVSQTVQVIGTTTAIACNDLVEVSLPADCSLAVNADLILEGTYACFDDYLVTITGLSGQPNYGDVLTAEHIGQTLKVTVKHLATGNTCWGQIKVEDKIAPSLTCQNLEVPCALAASPALYTPEALQTIFDWDFFNPFSVYPAVVECDDYTLDYTDTWVSLPCDPEPGGDDDFSGYVERIWTVTDASGNAAYCTQYIYFERAHFWDVTMPFNGGAICTLASTFTLEDIGVPFLTYRYNYDGQGAGQFVDWTEGNGFSALYYPVLPGAAVCDLQTTYSDEVLDACGSAKKILRTWTLYDGCLPTGPVVLNTSEINVVLTNPSAYVQVVEFGAVPPEFLEIPQDITVSTNPDSCCANVDLGSFLVKSECSGLSSAEAQVSWTDGNGNQVVECTVGSTLENFPGNNLWQPDTLVNFGLTCCLPLGTHRVLITLENECGRKSYREFYVTVEDQVLPEMVCVEFTQVALGSDGDLLLNATSLDNGSHDNCAPVYFKARRMSTSGCSQGSGGGGGNNQVTFRNQVRFCCSDVGDTLQVILRAYDVNPGAGTVGGTEFEGHYNDCMVQVLVEDKVKPVCESPVNVTVACENFDPSLWAYGQGAATDNCCVDTVTTSVSYASFDTICNRGTIVRTFRAFDCYGNSSQCIQRIVVTYGQYYFVKFPDDKTVGNCAPGGDYGKPTFYGEDCELLATSYVDEVFTVNDGACFKIERTWTVINWCTYNQNAPTIYVPNPNPLSAQASQQQLTGPTVSAPNNGVPGWTASVFTIDPGGAPWNYGTQSWTANANGYKYKQIIKVYDNNAPVATAAPYTCDPLKATTNDPQLWNSSFWYDASLASHDLCEEPTDLSITANDACAGIHVTAHYLLYLDLDHDGSMETVVNSQNPLANNQLQPGEVLFGNAASANFLTGTPQRFDFRTVPNSSPAVDLPLNERWVFALFSSADTVQRTARVVFRRGNQSAADANSPTVQLPHGTHKIKWIVEDGCGNQTVKEETFTVGDCKKPTVVCKNGLSINIMQTGMVTLWASDFLQYGEDNCTPAGQLKYGIRKSGTGTGFPTETSVTFDCTELGTQFVELWAQDKANNADFCETYVLVQDNMGACGSNNNASIAGALKTEEVEGVEDATVELEGSANGAPMFSQVFSNLSGNYAFSNALPIGSNYTVTPTSDLDPTNGVTTYDLVLINRHILGLETLSTPYKMIAADANKSNTITTFDIVEIRKLILGIYNEFPSNESWRFIDQTQVFPNPQNPFTEVLKENISVAQIQASEVDDDFVGVKIGDVNGTATPNQLTQSDDRTTGTLYFDLQDKTVKAGEEVTVNFKASDKQLGYQFTLNLNGLTTTGIEPGAGMSDENFAVFAEANAITTSVNGGAGEFAIKFRATQAGQLSQMLGISSRITKAESYLAPPTPQGGQTDFPPQGGLRGAVALRFNSADGNTTVSGLGFELYQNVPNPFVSKTYVGFHLPEAAEATLTVFDETGRTIYTQKGQFAKGRNAIALDRSVLAGGVLYYKLETATDSATKKMIQTK